MLRRRISKSCAALSLYLLSSAAYSVEVRPEINGTMDNACLQSSDNHACAFMGAGSSQSGAIPNNIYNALVSLADNVSHVKVTDLTVADSAGIGILIGDYDDHILIDKVDVGPVALAALDIRPNTNQIHVKNSSWHHSATCSWKHRDGSADDPNAPDACERSFPASVDLGGLDKNQPATNIVFENNDVYQGYGEGVGMYGTNTVWVVGNRIRGHRTAEVLVDNSNNILIESNICWDYDSNSDVRAVIGPNRYGEYPDYGARCFALGNETRPFAQDLYPTVVRNNISGGSSTCLQLLIWGAVETQYPGIEAAGQFYGNTCIGYTSSGIHDTGGATSPATRFERQIKNNIFYTDAGGTDCSLISSSAYDIEDVRNNSFSSNPVNSECDGPGDVYGKPALARDADSWDEANWTVSQGPTYADAVLLGSDPRINAGVPIESNLSFLDDVDWNYFGSVEYPCAPTASEWEKGLGTDYNCSSRSDSSPNMGADETN